MSSCSDFQAGDKVKVEGVVHSVRDGGRLHVRVRGDVLLSFEPSYVDLVERPKPQPKVGDKIGPLPEKHWVTGTGQIVAVHEGRAWIEWSSGEHLLIDIDSLLKSYRVLP